MAESTESNPEEIDFGQVLAHLGTLDKADQGETYLRSLGLHRDRRALIDLGSAAGLTRHEKGTKPELIRRILKITITARKKYEGLRHW